MRFDRARLALATGVLVLVMIGSNAVAGNMVYDQTMTGSGTLNGASFANATITFELDANTVNIIHPNNIDKVFGTGTVAISGVGREAILDPGYYVFTNGSGSFGPVGGVSGTNGDYYDIASNSLGNYDLVGDFGPITATNGSYGLQTGNIPTSGGTLDISSADTTEMFVAAAVPEPASVGLIGLAPLLLLNRRVRRVIPKDSQPVT